FNRDHPIQANTTAIHQDGAGLAGAMVLIPDQDVLEKRYAALIPGLEPARPLVPPVVTSVVPDGPGRGREIQPVRAESPVMPVSGTGSAAKGSIYRVQEQQGERLYDI